MKALHIHKTLEKDSELYLTELPYKKGQLVEIIVQAEPLEKVKIAFTARQLRDSGLVGLWKGHKDIKDSSDFARELREKAQRRN
ncbi:MAG: hypothetical protein HZA78_09965 [Candidatus Schekmanbacteria bacterium]|nr:hypothetical protein [Candidatus Schekmanbacteria bacterium]